MSACWAQDTNLMSMKKILIILKEALTLWKPVWQEMSSSMDTVTQYFSFLFRLSVGRPGTGSSGYLLLEGRRKWCTQRR